MLIKIKDGPKGARIGGLKPEILLAIQIAGGVWDFLGMLELVITAVSDGKHSAGSKHYIGHAVDLRSRNFSEAGKEKALALLKECLGPDFDVLDEGDHIHIEFDPKSPINGDEL